MRLVLRFSSLAIVVLIGTAGDRPELPGRVIAGPAADPWPAPAVTRPFVTFGWLAPPVSITTDARIGEMRGAGLTLALPAQGDSGRREDNLRRLGLAAAHGMRCILWDARFDRFQGLEPDSPRGGALLDSIVGDYRDRPGFFGYYLGDEPGRDLWPLLGRLSRQLARRDPAHPLWNNLLGRAAYPTRRAWEDATRGYVAAVRPAVLSNDQYDFLVSGDRGQFVENAAGLAAMAREAGVPFWSVVLLVQHGPYRSPTPGELAWQTSMLLAYGARGVGYFTYWTPPPDTIWNWHPAVITYEGDRTAWYPVLADWNRTLRATGERLAELHWITTEHAGSVPEGAIPFAADSLIAAVEGRAALGQFVDASGLRHVLVVNSDSSRARRVALQVVGPRRVWRLGDESGQWEPVIAAPAPGAEPVLLDLAPGGLALLRFDGGFPPLGAGRGPALAVSPTPASDAARISVSGLGRGGYVEIVDAAGRRVRRWRPGGGEAVFTWRGERDDGGVAPPGLYLVRAEDRAGVTVSRLPWLGRR